MQNLVFTLLICSFASAGVFANEQHNYSGDPIDISGNKYKKQNNFKDEELDFFEKELGDIKHLKVGFEKKGDVLDELNVEARDLSVHHKKYARKKLKYNSYIDKYKAQQACVNKTGNVDKCFKTETDNFIHAFNTQIQRHRGIFEQCYKKSLSNDDERKTAGLIDFRFRFLPSGHIEHISIVDKLNRKDRHLIRCVHAKIGAIKFPRTGKKDKIVIGKVFNFKLQTKTI